MSGTPCAGGCGFAGNPQQADLCSVCWRQMLQAAGADVPSHTPAAPAARGKVAVTRSELALPGGARIVVALGDMTKETVGAITNAANTSLDHAAGLAGAIVRAGGDVIQDESDRHVARHGRLDVGGVAVTTAGRLPCKHVLHAVAPTWRGGNEGEEMLLAVAARGCLDKAAALGCESVSIPGLGSGIFGVPRAVCARVLFDVALAYFAEHDAATTPLKTVRFTNFDEPTVGAFDAELKKRQAKMGATATAATADAPATTGGAADGAATP